MRALVIVLALASATWAAPHRDGANHHLGDDSFVAKFGREPNAHDPEALRMHVHLQYVRAWLAARPPTSPDLAARRAELLGYLDDYIAAGITPKNTYVARRSPVFIDADGRICAVGYLIERSVGRDLPERIAQAHRLDYLEDIAAAMPEVAAWVTSSGLSLDELASIQPGYMGPDVQHIEGFGSKDDKPDGDYKATADAFTFTGAFKKHEMNGEWKLVDDKGTTRGSGKFNKGSGTWTSFFADGKKLASGEFDNNHAEGAWKIFYPSGRVAAEGKMHQGRRDGTWTFFYDVKGSVKLSVGKFDNGETVGGWKHYDPDGKLLATTSGHPWQHLMLSVEPGKDGVRHEVDQGIPADSYRLDAFFLGDHKLYISDRSRLYDGDGNNLTKTDGEWMAHACKWSKARKRAAKNGDTAAVFQSFLTQDRNSTGGTDDDVDGDCTGDAKQVSKAKAEALDKMLASRNQVRAPIPTDAFRVDSSDVSRVHYEDEDNHPLAGKDNAQDMATYLADYMVWYVEWPHVDDPFLALYATLPGHKTAEEDLSAADTKAMR